MLASCMRHNTPTLKYVRVLEVSFFEDLGVCSSYHSQIECPIWSSVPMGEAVETRHRCMQQGKLARHSKQQKVCKISSNRSKYLPAAPILRCRISTFEQSYVGKKSYGAPFNPVVFCR